jgi:hypothetical protein
MTTIAVDQKYVDILNVFGDVPKQVEKAIRQYTVEQIQAEIEKCARENAYFEKKYGVTYEEFKERSVLDEDFYNRLRQIEQLWERDSIQWEFYVEGLKEWLGRLTDILQQ